MTTDPNSSKKRKANDPELHLVSDEEEDPSPRNFIHKKHGEKDRDSNNTIILPTSPTYQPEDKKEGYRKLSIRSANLALDYFNKNNHTKYVLVEDKSLAINNFNDHRGFWTHCSFNAKDSSVKQFFAEILTFHLSEPAVTCMILEGKTCVGCEYCPSSIIHPVDGYQAGCPNYSPDSSLSNSDDDEYPLMGPILNMEFADHPYITTESPPPSPCHYQGWLDQNIRFGNLALDTYNKENNTNFRLIVDADTMACQTFVDFYGVFVHSIFNAADDSSIQKQFFSEVHLDEPSNKIVALCKMLEEGHTRMGCYYCTSFIHPVDGFEHGCLKDGPNASSSVSDNDEDPLMDPNLNMERVEKDKDRCEKKISATSPTHQQED